MRVMNAQTVFYILASVFMALGIVLTVAVTVFTIVLIVQLRKAEHAVKMFLEKAERELSKLTEPKKALGLIPLVLSGISWFRNRKKK